jgi:hypothetical protein
VFAIAVAIGAIGRETKPIKALTSFGDAHVLIAVFIVNYLGRTNVGFAALTMNKDFGFSP